MGLWRPTVALSHSLKCRTRRFDDCALNSSSSPLKSDASSNSSTELSESTSMGSPLPAPLLPLALPLALSTAALLALVRLLFGRAVDDSPCVWFGMGCAASAATASGSPSIDRSTRLCSKGTPVSASTVVFSTASGHPSHC